MKIVSITGIDKSGKSTIVEEFNKLTGYQHYVIERDPTTVRFFCELLDRPFNENEYKKAIEKFNALPGLKVCLYCDSLVLDERFKKDNEPALPGNLSLYNHQARLIDLFLMAKYTNSLLLETTFQTARSCSEVIKNNL